MINMGEHQNKESPVRIIWEHHTTINPEKHDWLKEEGLSSLPEGEWAVTESQRGMTQGEVKNCMPKCNALKNGHLPETKSWTLYQRMSELLLSLKEGWRRMKWKLYAKVQRPEKRHLPKRKGWALYRRVSELLLSPKEGWCREWEE